MEVDEKSKEETEEKPTSPGPMKVISVPASTRSNREIEETIVIKGHK